MDNQPQQLSQDELRELSKIDAIREMWGAETPVQMQAILSTTAYAVKFHFVSGGPGYVGDYYLIQGDAIGEPPLQLIRRDERLVLLD